MIDTKQIDESIIPMNFSWRAGIATQQENEKFRLFKKWNQLMNKLKQA